MFGQNEIVGKKFFKDAPKDQLLVTSRFYTLQGEGPFRGHPSYFIRLAKCNLACSFCDTYFDSGTWKNFPELLEESDRVIEEFYTKRGMKVPEWAQDEYRPYAEPETLPRNIVLVITGGEPSLQDNLVGFLKKAKYYFRNMQIESNGIHVLEGLPEEVTLVVSPKCLEKKIDVVQFGTVNPREEYHAIRYLEPNPAMLERADCLKFVMCAPEMGEQFKPYAEVPQWAHDWAQSTKKPVFVSPMNIYLQEPKKAKELRAAKSQTEITIEERSEVDEVISFWEPGLLDMTKNQRNHEYAADYAMRHGFILNLQIHLFASLP
jgi:7-carboxy-7-deazaguanine synthase